MRSSALMTLLFNSGLPAGPYDVVRHSLAEREQMLEQLSGRTDTVVTANPAVMLLEIESEQTVYLITQQGHFAHPSIMRRSLVMQGGARAVRMTGFTAARDDIMSTWLEQFREQDECLGQAFTK
jgi:hypothetical protein